MPHFALKVGGRVEPLFSSSVISIQADQGYIIHAPTNRQHVSANPDFSDLRFFPDFHFEIIFLPSKKIKKNKKTCDENMLLQITTKNQENIKEKIRLIVRLFYFIIFSM